MTREKAGKIALIPFIATMVGVAIIIISVIFAAISRANVNVQRSTEEHAINDMIEDSDNYAKIINFAADNGITDFDHILDSEAFTFKMVFIADDDGHIIAKSKLAKYSIDSDNIFDFFSGAAYLGSMNEQIIRTMLKNDETGTYRVQHQQKEYLVFRPLGNRNFNVFYMLHQGDVEHIYDESAKYLKSLRFLGVAYVTATIAFVILIGSYIFSIVTSVESQLRISNTRVRNAQEQVRTYSDITRVLTQSYEKIYYVNLLDNHYKVFNSLLSAKNAPMQYEGEDFWNTVRSEISEQTIEKDRELVENFFDKNYLSELVNVEGSRRIRFKMMVDGVETYYYLRACKSETKGQQYLIIGLKNVDAMVVHDMNQLAEKEAALRRVDIYRNALLDNMIAYLELNITQCRVIEGPFIADKDSGERRPLETRYRIPENINDLFKRWGEYLYPEGKDRDDYIKRCSGSSLKNEFETGNSIVELNYDAKWNDGTVRGIRQNFYMSKSGESGDILALCVLYDVTEKNARDREIKTLTEELAQSRIKISTGQMQPHFLYNVLGSIREIILEDPQYASDLICDFTTHLRACVKSLSNDDLVSFSKEIENIKAYVNIERMRFGDRMQVEFDIQYEDFDVVPLSIQPLVENAIRHGLFPKRDGMGVVKISSYYQDGYAVIIVKDNGVGFDYNAVNQEILGHKRDSTGLINLTLRLEKILDAKVHFDSQVGVGTTVTIMIPGKREDAKS